MKTLFLAMFLTSCATTPEGGLTHSAGFYLEDIVCKIDEPYYLSMTTTTHWETGYQVLEISWQCKENDGARVYKELSNTCNFEQSEEDKAKCKEQQ